MSDFRIKTYVLGMVSTNCYIVYNEKDKKAVIVDPADNAAFILNKCRELELTPEAVLITHGHFDHIMAVNDLVRAFRVKIYAGAAEDELLKNPELNLSCSMISSQISVTADMLLNDGETIDLIGYKWKAISVPGHTAGCTGYLIEDEGVLFSGDTLFYESYGRTDLPTGSISQIVRSINDKLFILPEDIMVYPGHGEPTSIGHEKRYNPASGL